MTNNTEQPVPIEQPIDGDEMKPSQKIVTVCDYCLTESCWKGNLMCAKAKTAGTITDTEENISKMTAKEDAAQPPQPKLEGELAAQGDGQSGYEPTEARIKRNLDIGRGMLDGPEPDYSKLDDVEYGDTVAIEWSGELLEGVTDYGYVFCWPDIEAGDANMGGVIHIPYPENPGGKDRADAEWVTWYELGTNPLVKKVRRVASFRAALAAVADKPHQDDEDATDDDNPIVGGECHE